MITPTTADLILLDGQIFGYRGEMTEYPKSEPYTITLEEIKAKAQSGSGVSSAHPFEELQAAFKRDCLLIEDQERALLLFSRMFEPIDPSSLLGEALTEGYRIHEEVPRGREIAERLRKKLEPTRLYRVECRLGQKEQCSDGGNWYDCSKEHYATYHKKNPNNYRTILRFKEDISQHKVYERNFPDGSREVIFETDEDGRPIWSKALEEAANWKPVADPEVRVDWITNMDEGKRLFINDEEWVKKFQPDRNPEKPKPNSNQEELWNEVKMAFFSFDTKTEAIDWLKSKFSISRKPQQE